MSISAILGMVVILGIVVGGFVFFLSLAIKAERRKNNPDIE